ncbi:hypothetical protein KZ813_00040 [Sphingomonas sp. RHCKR7]|uniref:DUF5703 domain-containing protein n=1 Tax=Sphingomonas folli TaxID=2862497 RepID=UPI001C66EBA8|nr:DUF5703 domain-containing protein [Sphingomonas folli]MBW6525226.1 hypothetical protein [Sphingomonas folli]
MDKAKRATLAGLTATAVVAPARPGAGAERRKDDVDPLDRRMAGYDPVWRSASRDAGESMPCGAGDIGLNVWVEGDDVLFYVARSGAFDETNSYLKLGRARLRFDPSPFGRGASFEQRLSLVTGEMVVTCGNLVVTLWADVASPIVRVAVESSAAVAMTATWESWRTHDRDYLPAEMSMHRAYDGAPVTPRQYGDEVGFAEGGVLSLHHNRDNSVFDLLVEQQGLDEVKDQLWNPLAGLGFGALLRGDGFVPAGTVEGRYASTAFIGWTLGSRCPQRRHALRLFCHVAQAPTRDEWVAGLRRLAMSDPGAAVSRRRSRRWWRSFWERSWIVVEPGAARPNSQPWRIGRNYQLFRHQLGTNARGTWPTKFNGGNFTVDPEFTQPELRLSPDYRAWGGGEFTAQNQRLVHWPMLKSGDADLMRPQLDFYRRLRRTAELRTQRYWGHKGACFVEQIENFGLCCGQEWGWQRTWNKPATRTPGVEDSAFVDYLWDTVLEFCLMMLEVGRFTGVDVSGDLAFVDSCLTFFDEHYRREHARITGSELSADGKLVLFPGTACETYKNTLNSTVTIAGLDAVLAALLALPERMLGTAIRARYAALRATLPKLPTRRMSGRQVIAPAALWDRIQNVEIPQLYPVFPYHRFGVGLPNLQLAVDTWHHGVDTAAQKDIKSWHQDAIFCARLGLTDEAAKLTARKMEDSGRRYSTFWGPGHDWAPDHNWGGSGMIGLQEMLMQTPGDSIHLFPAWPREWDVDFRLHAPHGTRVDATLQAGRLVALLVEPPAAQSRVVLPAWANGLELS